MTGSEVVITGILESSQICPYSIDCDLFFLGVTPVHKSSRIMKIMKTKTQTHLKSSALVVSAIAAAISAKGSGDYGPAIWNPNCGQYYTSGYGHKFHVVHDIEGYYLSTISYFKNCSTQASVHYLVNGKQDSSTDAPAGEITQMVADVNYAWHVRCWNQHCTGTEHEGFSNNPAWYTETMYDASSGITRHLSQRFGWPIDRNHVVGHDEKRNSAWVTYARNNLGIDPTCNTHGDPGPYWKWNHYIALTKFPVYGAILAHYNAIGADNAIGDPITGDAATPGNTGFFNHFSANASIYYSASTGAQDVRGAIRDHWAALGWEQGPLGFPTTSDAATPGNTGFYNHFKNNASIYWSGATGAQDVRGAIRDKWSSLGWEQSYLGFPSSDVYNITGGQRQNFQGNTITYNSATGQTSIP